MQNKRLVLLFTALLLPGLSFALPSDKTKPAKISANTADYNQKTGISVFSGNVIIIQGTTKITANQLTTYTDKHQHLSKAIALGSKATPAQYQTLPKKGDAIFKASAEKIEYLPLKNHVVLIGHGKLEQNHNTLESNYIIYNQKTGQLTTKYFGEQRTTIVLQPSMKKKT